LWCFIQEEWILIKFTKIIYSK